MKWFNRLYLRVTTSVGGAVVTPAFNDTAFMTKLDVVFANLYFSALAAGPPTLAGRHRRGGRCWRHGISPGSRVSSSRLPE